MPNPTVSKTGESGLVFAKNKTTNQVETIATTADMQIGLSGQPANLLLNGAISVSTLDLTIAAGSTKSIPDSSTNVNVTTTGASGLATLSLPASPKKGQLVYIKDVGGNAATVSITVIGSPKGTKTAEGTSPHLIDGSASKSITTSYGALQLLWNGSGWSIVSNINIVTAPAPTDASYVVLSSNATLTNERVLTAGSNISIVDGGAGSTLTISATGGAGDVVGPASATDNAIARFDLTTGKLIQNSAATVADSTGNITTYDAEVGSLSGFAGTYAMFGHKTQTALGQYAVVHKNDGETWLSSATDKYIRFTTDGNPTYDGFIGYSTFFGKSIISLTGRSGVKTSATLGNTAADSNTTIDSGTGNIDVGTSSTARTINIGTGLASQTINLGASWSSTAINLNAGTGRIDMSSTSTTSADATIGAAQVGSLPGFAGSVAMFGHDDLNHSVNNDTSLGMGNYALAQGNDGATYLNSPFDKGIYFLTSGSANALGRIYFKTSTLSSEISLTGAPSFNTNFTAGSTYGASSLKLDSGTGNIDVGTSSTARTINIGTGLATQTISLGSSWAATSITLNAGTGRVSMSSTSTTKADATIGGAQVGSLPGSSGGVAMFGHNNLNHAVNNDTALGMGNYALAQLSTGETYINSRFDKGIYLAASGSTNYLGRVYFDSGDLTSKIILEGASSFDTDISLGSSYGGSRTDIYAGSGNMFLSVTAGSSIKIAPDPFGITNQVVEIGNNATATEINIKAGDEFVGVGGVNITAPMTTRGETVMGAAQLGSLPLFGYPRTVAFFGNNSLNHSVNNDTSLGMGNYAIAQLSTGETYVNSRIDKGIYFAASGSTNYLGRIYFDSGDLTSKITLGGASSFDADVSLGSSYGGSRTDIYAGSGNMFLSVNAGSTISIAPDPLGVTNQIVQVGNNTTATEVNIKAGDEFVGVGGVNITAPMTTRGELAAGAVQLGSLPLFGYPRTVAFFGNNSLNHSVNPTTLDGMGNYALAQGTDGSTYLNSPWNKGIYFLTSGSGLFPLGRIYFNSNTSTSEISFKGVETLACNLSLGSVTGSSSTKMFGGSGGILLSATSGLTTITGSTSTSTEAIIGMAAVGELPFTRVSLPNSYAVFSHKTLDNSVNGNYALVQSYNGYTYLNSPTSITFQYAGSSIGGGTIGTLDNSTVSFTGLAGTSTTTTIGNTAGTSSTTVDAGTGNIDIGTSATARTINVGPTGAAGVTFTINIGTSTGGGTSGSPRTINIGDYGSGYSAVNLEADYVNVAKNAASALGFYGASPKTKFTVTGSRGGNAALLAVLDVLERLGLINDSSTA